MLLRYIARLGLLFLHLPYLFRLQIVILILILALIFGSSRSRVGTAFNPFPSRHPASASSVVNSPHLRHSVRGPEQKQRPILNKSAEQTSTR